MSIFQLRIADSIARTPRYGMCTVVAVMPIMLIEPCALEDTRRTQSYLTQSVKIALVKSKTWITIKYERPSKKCRKRVDNNFGEGKKELDAKWSRERAITKF